MHLSSVLKLYEKDEQNIIDKSVKYFLSMTLDLDFHCNAYIHL